MTSLRFFILLSLIMGLTACSGAKKSEVNDPGVTVSPGVDIVTPDSTESEEAEEEPAIQPDAPAAIDPDEFKNAMLVADPATVYVGQGEEVKKTGGSTTLKWGIEGEFDKIAFVRKADQSIIFETTQGSSEKETGLLYETTTAVMKVKKQGQWLDGPEVVIEVEKVSDLYPLNVVVTPYPGRLPPGQDTRKMEAAFMVANNFYDKICIKVGSLSKHQPPNGGKLTMSLIGFQVVVPTEPLLEDITKCFDKPADPDQPFVGSVEFTPEPLDADKTQKMVPVHIWGFKGEKKYYQNVSYGVLRRVPPSVDLRVARTVPGGDAELKDLFLTGFTNVLEMHVEAQYLQDLYIVTNAADKLYNEAYIQADPVHPPKRKNVNPILNEHCQVSLQKPGGELGKVTNAGNQCPAVVKTVLGQRIKGYEGLFSVFKISKGGAGGVMMSQGGVSGLKANTQPQQQQADTPSPTQLALNAQGSLAPVRLYVPATRDFNTFVMVLGIAADDKKVAEAVHEALPTPDWEELLSIPDAEWMEKFQNQAPFVEFNVLNVGRVDKAKAEHLNPDSCSGELEVKTPANMKNAVRFTLRCTVTGDKELGWKVTVPTILGGDKKQTKIIRYSMRDWRFKIKLKEIVKQDGAPKGFDQITWEVKADPPPGAIGGAGPGPNPFEKIRMVPYRIREYDTNDRFCTGWDDEGYKFTEAGESRLFTFKNYGLNCHSFKLQGRRIGKAEWEDFPAKEVSKELHKYVTEGPGSLHNSTIEARPAPSLTWKEESVNCEWEEVCDEDDCDKYMHACWGCFGGPLACAIACGIGVKKRNDCRDNIECHQELIGERKVKIEAEHIQTMNVLALESPDDHDDIQHGGSDYCDLLNRELDDYLEKMEYVKDEFSHPAFEEEFACKLYLRGAGGHPSVETVVSSGKCTPN